MFVYSFAKISDDLEKSWHWAGKLSMFIVNDFAMELMPGC